MGAEMAGGAWAGLRAGFWVTLAVSQPFLQLRRIGRFLGPGKVLGRRRCEAAAARSVPDRRAEARWPLSSCPGSARLRPALLPRGARNQPALPSGRRGLGVGDAVPENPGAAGRAQELPLPCRSHAGPGSLGCEGSELGPAAGGQAGSAGGGVGETCVPASLRSQCEPRRASRSARPCPRGEFRLLLHPSHSR